MTIRGYPCTLRVATLFGARARSLTDVIAPLRPQLYVYLLIFSSHTHEESQLTRKVPNWHSYFEKKIS